MSGVAKIIVRKDDDDIRVDRWFKRHYPDLSHIRLEKLLRKGEVRVDGGRVKAGTRLVAGQEIRVPPMTTDGDRPRKAPGLKITLEDVQYVKNLVLYRDDDVIVLNKPCGLAVQGGTKTERHLDGLLGGLKYDLPDRPKLVHRLDRDTSGVLVLARTSWAASRLARAFKEKDAQKIYWGLVAGAPKEHAGTINLALRKGGGLGNEKMFAVAPGTEIDGVVKSATTHFATVTNAGRRLAWVAFMPVTGRTHQIRVHAATALETPIVGDGKYGGEAAHPGGALSNKLHLHAREINIAHPSGGRLIVTAHLPPHMAESWKTLGFELSDANEPFAEMKI